MKKSQKILAFISIAIACFLTVLDSTIVNVSLPSMAVYFNTNTTGISWISTAYLIAFSSLLINFSKIADIYGRKKLFLIGLILFGAASVLCGLADSLNMLIIFRIIQGVGAAILTPLSIPLGIEIFGKKAMGKLAVIVGMTISISAASGPVIGGILNEYFNYKAIFYVNTPFVIIAFILGALYIKECYDETIEKKIDFLGCILLAVGLGALTFALVKGNDYGWSSTKIILMFTVSVAAIIAFVIYEIKIKNPMIEFSIFKVKSFTASIILIAVFFFAYMPVSYLLNFYFENTLGYSVLKAGLMMGIPSVAALISAPLLPLIAKNISDRVVSFVSIVIVAVGNLMFAFMDRENHMTIIITSFILLGIGVRITTSLYQTAYEEISKDKNAMASGIQNSLRQLCACIAIALVSTLSSNFTTTAVQNTKSRISAEINRSTVLEVQVKTSFNDKIKTSGSKDSSGFSKSAVHNIFIKREDAILKTVPYKMKETVIENFKTQEKEVDRIVDDASKIKEEESYKVYNKCFLITGIIAMIGLLAVPFNKKKEHAETVSGTEAVNL
ncbi:MULTISPECIES: DHA2 family efflux MFS transporter permease subunit [Clostridium]|uniref:DHA2 family efflux MFS transporter permease subunit n=1 Tax=Clostridium TaxID=1485 RepID=UPI0008245183|nr:MULTISPECIES: DHA2 family efflux MFS transporter permease subunit [Clostridium]PJI06840.1 MFS transporter [Clostridium sp. CT7]